jgi:hypothetical protein
MSEKFEFASPAWVDAARECIVELSRGQDLSAVSVSFCEEFTDPPAHLCPTGGSIGWHLVISNGKLEVAAGVVDADLKIIADYTKALALARATHAEIAADPEIAETASKFRREGDLTKMASLAWMSPVHDFLTERTR